MAFKRNPPRAIGGLREANRDLSRIAAKSTASPTARQRPSSWETSCSAASSIGSVASTPTSLMVGRSACSTTSKPPSTRYSQLIAGVAHERRRAFSSKYEKRSGHGPGVARPHRGDARGCRGPSRSPAGASATSSSRGPDPSMADREMQKGHRLLQNARERGIIPWAGLWTSRAS